MSDHNRPANSPTKTENAGDYAFAVGTVAQQPQIDKTIN